MVEELEGTANFRNDCWIFGYVIVLVESVEARRFSDKSYLLLWTEQLNFVDESVSR